MLTSCLVINAQEYCVQFSKEDKKTVRIEEGRNISFVFSGSEEWQKGKITKITKDSIFVEQPIAKKDILVERESNYVATGYDLTAFRMMAYPTTTSVAGKGAIVVLLVAGAVTLTVLGGGAGLSGIPWSDEGEEKNSKAKEKFFKKNVDFDRGWKAEIVSAKIK